MNHEQQVNEAIGEFFEMLGKSCTAQYILYLLELAHKQGYEFAIAHSLPDKVLVALQELEVEHLKHTDSIRNILSRFNAVNITSEVIHQADSRR